MVGYSQLKLDNLIFVDKLWYTRIISYSRVIMDLRMTVKFLCDVSLQFVVLVITSIIPRWPEVFINYIQFDVNQPKIGTSHSIRAVQSRRVSNDILLILIKFQPLTETRIELWREAINGPQYLIIIPGPGSGRSSSNNKIGNSRAAQRMVQIIYNKLYLL